jgi:hypothetical protein
MAKRLERRSSIFVAVADLIRVAELGDVHSVLSWHRPRRLGAGRVNFGVHRRRQALAMDAREQVFGRDSGHVPARRPRR